MDGYKIIFIFILTTLALVYGRRVENPCSWSDYFPCDNYSDGEQCISRDFWCDNVTDCKDQSDEKYCQKGSSNFCNDKHFECGDRRCIPAAARCDGHPNCDDGSDEQNCDTIDLDGPRHPNVREPDTTTPTTTTELYTSISTSYAGHRRDDSSNRDRQYGYREAYTTAKPYEYPRVYQHQDRDSDAYPNARFPNIPPHGRDTTPQGRGYIPTTINRPDPSGYPRDRPMVHPPRSILFPPRRTPFSSTRQYIRRPDFRPFYFAKNYTNDIAYTYERKIRSGKDWIMNLRDRSYSWGRDTPRALIALSLITNNFKSDLEDNELLRKGLQTYLGIKVLRNSTGLQKIGTTRLAMYINALLATCQDPRDFMGIDLVEILFHTQNYLEQHQVFVNPLIYLTLCLTDKPVPVIYLQSFLGRSFQSEIDKDFHILATIAMACVAQQNPRDNSIRMKLDEAAQNLFNQMNRTDGSFGSKYSTALAAQALMSVNSTRWNPDKTMKFLAQQQLNDGSFGDMQSTYYSLIALSGRSLVHLRNTECDPVDVKKEWSPEDILNGEGPRKNILYTLRVGYPEVFSAAMQLSVPRNTTFFDIMRVAAYQDPRFKFEYEVGRNKAHSVHTIANIPSDPERGMFWTLYRLPSSQTSVDYRQRYLENIIDLIPDDGDELLYWYLSDHLISP